MVKKNEISFKETVLKESLKSFQNELDVFSKGKLSLVIQLTRMAVYKHGSIYFSSVTLL